MFCDLVFSDHIDIEGKCWWIMGGGGRGRGGAKCILPPPPKLLGEGLGPLPPPSIPMPINYVFYKCTIKYFDIYITINYFS